VTKSRRREPPCPSDVDEGGLHPGDADDFSVVDVPTCSGPRPLDQQFTRIRIRASPRASRTARVHHDQLAAFCIGLPRRDQARRHFLGSTVRGQQYPSRSGARAAARLTFLDDCNGDAVRVTPNVRRSAQVDLGGRSSASGRGVPVAAERGERSAASSGVTPSGRERGTTQDPVGGDVEVDSGGAGGRPMPGDADPAGSAVEFSARRLRTGR